MRIMQHAIWLAIFASSSASAQEFPEFKDHVTDISQTEEVASTGLGISATSDLRKLEPLALDLIKDFEAWRASPYNDASMYCTVGYGHLIAKRPCANATSELGLLNPAPPLAMSSGVLLLNKDTTRVRQSVAQRVHRTLSDEQFGAIVSLAFNIGVANFSNSTLLRYLNNGEDLGVSREFGRWVMSKGVVLDGLISRRACEAALFQGKLKYRHDGKFYRSDCGSLGAAASSASPIDIAVGESR